MTEQDWFDCPHILPMAEFLQNKISPRKLGLFACACCRRIWHLLKDERSRTAVEVRLKPSSLTAAPKPAAGPVPSVLAKPTLPFQIRRDAGDSPLGEQLLRRALRNSIFIS